MSKYLIKALKTIEKCEVHPVISDAAKRNWELETDSDFKTLLNLEDKVYDVNNIAEAISSGSLATDGMIVLPCSMKTLAGIVSGYADNLLLRAVDVCLKENRRVVLCTREMTFSKIHLRNMSKAADLGCVILSPVLTFYNGASSVDE